MRAITVVPMEAGSAALSEVPEPGEEEGTVLVETLAVGVCGTDMEIVTGGTSGGSGGDPTRMDSLVWSTYGPTSGFGSELVYGVTSARAAAVQIVFSGSTAPLRATLYTAPRFPGLRFYAAVAPASAARDRIVAEALAADGTPLVRTDPNRPSPLGG